MTPRKFAIIAVSAAAAAVGGCASDNQLSTSSLNQSAQAQIDPTCVALSNEINTLRSEGTVDRLEQAASGKGKNVQVKRTALAKQAELNKANAEFQAKCGPKIPQATTAQAAPPQAQTTQTAAAAPPQPQN